VWYRFRPRIQLTLGVTDQGERLENVEQTVGRLQARQREIELVLQHIGALPTRPAGRTQTQTTTREQARSHHGWE
jgi:hypothetical protein